MIGVESTLTARACIGERAIEHERLNIPVKNDADEFAGFVHDGTAAVAADDVSIGNEIEFRRQIQLGFAIDPALRQGKRRFAIVFGSTLIKSLEIRKRRKFFPYSS